MIGHFDVVPNPSAHARKVRPFYVCVQHHQLDHLRTRVMAPLVATDSPDRSSRLHPVFEVEGFKVYLDPTDLVTMNVRHLGDAVTNLELERYRIVSALDLVFTGI